MLDYGHPFFLAVRRLGQKSGLLRPMVRVYRKLRNAKYEDRFDDALMRSIKKDDVVWDVGANIGVYTEKFAEAVSSGGLVIAFEPTPSTADILRNNTTKFAQVRIVQAALSDKEAEADFIVDEQHTTNTLATAAKKGNSIKVKMMRGDQFAAEAFPNIIKIDVEGFEIDVVAGLTGMLNDPRLRAIFIEVHFLEIGKRGLSHAISEMTHTLQRAGFQLEWLDPSHLEARRPKHSG
eukprot:gene29327-32921_t